MYTRYSNGVRGHVYTLFQWRAKAIPAAIHWNSRKGYSSGYGMAIPIAPQRLFHRKGYSSGYSIAVIPQRLFQRLFHSRYSAKAIPAAIP